MHCMIDMETLDTAPSCVILSIGAVIFDPKSTGILGRFEVRPTIEDQCDIGRTISDATLQWWGTQSKAAQDEAFGEEGRIPFKDAMEALYKFAWNKERVWSHGAVFDVIACEDAWRKLDMNFPWQFWNVRDTRTLYEVTGVSLKDGKHVTTHKAIEDAIHQAKTVQRAYKILMDAGVMPR